MFEIEGVVDNITKASALARLSEALLELGDLTEARRRADQAVASAIGSGNIWDARPWYALARVSIKAGDRTAAARALQDLNDEITRTGSLMYYPFMHELRVQYAAAVNEVWDYDEEIREAHRLFTEIGATGHADRVAVLM